MNKTKFDNRQTNFERSLPERKAKMFETDDFASTPAISEATKPMREPLREPSPEFVIECENLLPEFENQPRSASELARHFGVTDRAVQNWYPIIRTAYLWLPETDLKTGTGKNTRYLPPAVKAMVELRDARAKGQTADQWVASVHRENGEAIAQFKASQLPPTEPAVEQSGELAKVVPVEVVPSLTALQQDLYKVDEFGASRLALANERLAQTGQNLSSTLEQTREAMRNLAMQQFQATQADEAERKERLNREYMAAYQEELALIQARNMAREDARMQSQAMEQAIKGKAQSPSASA